MIHTGRHNVMPRAVSALVSVALALSLSQAGEGQSAAPASVRDGASADRVIEEVLGQPGEVVGWIDWTNATVSAWGKGATQTEAEADARKVIGAVLLVVSVDEAGTVGDRILANAGYAAPVRALVAKAKIGESKQEKDGWRVRLETSMLGKEGLIALLLAPPPTPVAVAVTPLTASPEVMASEPVKPASQTPRPVAVTPTLAQPVEEKRPEPMRAAETLVQAAAPTTATHKKEGKEPPATTAPATPPPAPQPQPPANVPAAPASPPAEKREATPPPPAVVPPVSKTEPPPIFAPLDVATTGPFTGLIIDARGLGVQRCISPRIQTQSGKIVYGYWEKLTEQEIDKIRSTGTVGYLISADAAPKSRAGNRPLVIRALAKEGAASGYAIISDQDGERILHEDATSHFLKLWAVAFLIKP